MLEIEKITWLSKLRLNYLVRKEATLLKINATKEEINALDFTTLNPNHKNHCIYGQMTGNCYNSRAIWLIEKCANRVYNGTLMSVNKLNGNPIDSERYEYLSPIELFVYRNRYGINVQNNKRLIEYLKGDIDKLKFI